MMGSDVKRWLGGLALVLVAVVGCSNNPAMRLRYEAEKKLDHADRLMKKAQISPDLANHQTVGQVRDAYREATDFTLKALDKVNPSAHAIEYRELQQLAFVGTQQLARLLYREHRYDDAISALTRFIKQPDLEPGQVLTSRINLGRVLQSAGQFDSALAVYNHTLEDFYPPVDKAGEVRLALFNLPMAIYQIKSAVGDTAGAEQQWQRADDYYSGLITKYPGSKVATAAHGNLASLYELVGQWQKSVDELEALPDTTSRAYHSIRLRIADICTDRLHQNAKALAIYNDFLKTTTPADTVNYPLLRYKIASVKINQKNYDEARKILNDLKENYPRFYASYPQAQYAMARSFELENNWPRALVEYTYLVENYRGSDEAMQAYLYVAAKLKKLGRTGESKEWYDDADKYYQQIERLASGTNVEARALTYRAEIARIHQDWPHAAGLLTQVYDRFPNTDAGRRALIQASLLYREKMNQPQVADSLMQVLKTSLADLLPGPKM